MKYRREMLEALNEYTNLKKDLKNLHIDEREEQATKIALIKANVLDLGDRFDVLEETQQSQHDMLMFLVDAERQR